MRLIPVLGAIAIAFAVLDFLSSVISSPGCGHLANWLWFIPDLRPLTSAWITWVIGVFSVVFTYGIVSLVLLAVMSSLSGGLFGGHIAAALINSVLRKAIAVLLSIAILHVAVQALVELLC
jgi:hypothetical protein